MESKKFAPGIVLSFTQEPYITRNYGPLAAEVGLLESIITLQFDFWMMTLPGKVVDGRKWIFKSAADMKKEFLQGESISTINRAINNLIRRGILLARSDLNKLPGDRTRHFSFDFDAVRNLKSVQPGPGAELLTNSPELTLLMSQLEQIEQPQEKPTPRLVHSSKSAKLHTNSPRRARRSHLHTVPRVSAKCPKSLQTHFEQPICQNDRPIVQNDKPLPETSPETSGREIKSPLPPQVGASDDDFSSAQKKKKATNLARASGSEKGNMKSDKKEYSKDVGEVKSLSPSFLTKKDRREHSRASGNNPRRQGTNRRSKNSSAPTAEFANNPKLQPFLAILTALAAANPRGISQLCYAILGRLEQGVPSSLIQQTLEAMSRHGGIKVYASYFEAVIEKAMAEEEQERRRKEKAQEPLRKAIRMEQEAREQREQEKFQTKPKMSLTQMLENEIAKSRNQRLAA